MLMIRTVTFLFVLCLVFRPTVCEQQLEKISANITTPTTINKKESTTKANVHATTVNVTNETIVAEGGISLNSNNLNVSKQNLKRGREGEIEEVVSIPVPPTAKSTVKPNLKRGREGEIEEVISIPVLPTAKSTVKPHIANVTVSDKIEVTESEKDFNASSHVIIPKKGATFPYENTTKVTTEKSTTRLTLINETTEASKDFKPTENSKDFKVTEKSVTNKSTTDSKSTTRTTETTVTVKPKKPTVTIGSDEEDQLLLKSKNVSNGNLPSIEYYEQHDTNKGNFVLPIVLVILSVPVVAIIINIVYKRGKEWWTHRHYRRMDFLVDGMYNN